MKQQQEITIFWFRRDLRTDDNTALFHALKDHNNVLSVFIFDTDILDKLDNKQDRRVEFIHAAVNKLREQFEKAGSSLRVIHSSAKEAFTRLEDDYTLKAVYCNHDYEPGAIERDEAVKSFLASKKIPFFSFKDQVVFEKTEISKDDGLPYTVFTPYMKKWKSKLTENDISPRPSETLFKNLLKTEAFHFPSLQDIGFRTTGFAFAIPAFNEKTISDYHDTRNFPAVKGTSRLSVHLRFGTISIRQLVKRALKLNDQWLNELIWREFYMMILFNFPHVVKGSFRKKYDGIPWLNNEEHFERWCNGTTGYPIVDAGMRELNATGFMHNRVRMITASFLVKHLLIDWRWGEAYFAEKLTDYDLSANNGGWQWAASSGCDAAPYFRVFNPTEQTKRFDPKFEYISMWVPEFQNLDYPQPIVEHRLARERVLAVFKKALA